MYNFESDYTEGAHERILKALIDTNLEQLSGYGEDHYCESAKEKIKDACQCKEADVHFLVGGTQTNQVVIDAMLNSYEGVVTARTGHVNCHEAGAIEYTGHKVIEIDEKCGKIDSENLDDYLTVAYADSNLEHMVYPGLCYISWPTEYGTLYSKKELEDIYAVCKKHAIPLFIDGARLGYGLMSHDADITLPELAKLCDVFYIGGTKVGALCGEAVVFTHNNTPKHFFTIIKQHGALMAKRRLLGIQFDVLFTDNLYMDISKHAIDMAMMLKKIAIEKGYKEYLDSPTNQQFFIVEDTKLKELEKKIKVSIWERYDADHTVIRLATSWATTEKQIEYLREIL